MWHTCMMRVLCCRMATCRCCTRMCAHVEHLCVVLQDAHLSMLRKDMSLLDLELLELKLKLKLGDAYSGSPVQVQGQAQRRVMHGHSWRWYWAMSWATSLGFWACITRASMNIKLTTQHTWTNSTDACESKRAARMWPAHVCVGNWCLGLV